MMMTQVYPLSLLEPPRPELYRTRAHSHTYEVDDSRASGLATDFQSHSEQDRLFLERLLAGEGRTKK